MDFQQVDHPHALPEEELFRRLEATEKGLSTEEAQRRLGDFGSNQLDKPRDIPNWKLFLLQFKSFTIYILLIAVALSLVLGEYVDAIIIAIILMANALIGFFQELGAQKSIDSLMSLEVPHARVLRDGHLQEVEARCLVPGDVVEVEAGDRVPADIRLLRSANLSAQESALTGESVPVNKKTGEAPESAGPGDRFNMLFSSTTISKGNGRGLVVQTGMQTQIGHIATLVQKTKEPRTPLQGRLDNFGKKLGLVVIGICLLVLVVIGLRDYLTHGWEPDRLLKVFLVAVALAVAAVPEGLPAVVTIALSIGVQKLLKQKALVRRLAAVETLGSCDVICTDKTGTLTRNAMTVVKGWTLTGECRLSGEGYDPGGSTTGDCLSDLFIIGAVCNHASAYQDEEGNWKYDGDPTEVALLVSAQKVLEVIPQLSWLDELPFDSNRKMMSVVVEQQGREQWVKGAPDKILSRCQQVQAGGEVQPLSEVQRTLILDQIESYSKQALRVLAFARKNLEPEDHLEEKDLIFVGLQAMQDPPRSEVGQALEKTQSAGIRTIMVTGDFAETAQAIAQKVGIKGKTVDGHQVDQMDDGELVRLLEKDTNVFARVVPEHKQRIVKALQSRGSVVAMTGDGVNDAPALKTADIGVAVGSGTDVAKESSDFVLLDDSFKHIVNAVEEGRGIFDNIQKAIMLLLSGNLSEVLIIIGAVLLGWDLPLTAVMLLWINLITDGAPALAMAVDPYGKDIMSRPPLANRGSILPKDKLLLIGILGVWASALGLGLFYRFGVGPDAHHQLASTLLFTFLVVAELVIMLLIRGYFKTRFFSNRWVWFSVLLCLGLQAMLIYTGLSDLFGLARPNLSAYRDLAIALGVFSVGGIGITALARRIFQNI